MKSFTAIIACCLCAAAASPGVLAQTDAAGAGTTASPAPVPANGTADEAEKLDVPLAPTRNAPVTVPGAPVTDNAPVVTPPPKPHAMPDTGSTAQKEHPWYVSDPEAYSIISAGHGLSLHKPMYLLPLTYSENYHGRKSEVLFALSLKQRLFGIPLYFGYSQKSFFDVLDSKDSKPFRETVYNPELFYRWVPADRTKWHHLGMDFGIEHESNGQSLPDSRSWNRIYLSPFQAAGTHLVYWKWWWRIPEDKSLPPTDPNRDDNPDIQNYYGYSELHIEQQLFDRHLAHAMFRYNPATGKGAINLQYSIPAAGGSFFWGLYVWHGYGESLIDYNHAITRVGLGVMIAR